MKNVREEVKTYTRRNFRKLETKFQKTLVNQHGIDLINVMQGIAVAISREIRTPVIERLEQDERKK